MRYHVVHVDESADEGIEREEWHLSLEEVLHRRSPASVTRLLHQLQWQAHAAGIPQPWALTTPSCNTIAADQEPPYPGDLALERRLEHLVRWNAVAMVERANRADPAIGGHLATYASAATLYEVGFHHFFRGRDGGQRGDQIYFQGHAAPGIYARAFLEGRFTETQLSNFRQELAPGGGLPSYPHPWSLPAFWEFPTVSMGLGPLMGIYQARLNRYLEARGLLPPDPEARIWVFVGDGEMDEPEALGALQLAAREQLDNLILVVNCNLQRLDGPVRGNGHLIQDLEAVFHGMGWHVLKVLWSSDWDALLAADQDGRLVQRLGAIRDGEYQYVTAAKGPVFWDLLCQGDPHLAAQLRDVSEARLRALRRGGHDPVKVSAAYQAARTHRGAPSVILAQTLKGYGLGKDVEGLNSAHQRKRLSESALQACGRRWGIPLPEAALREAAFYRPPEDSPELQYLRACRQRLGGPVPRRVHTAPSLPTPPRAGFALAASGPGVPQRSTTHAAVHVLTTLLRDPTLGPRLVPIIPDEARTFGLDPLFRLYGIYTPGGQRYTPVDHDMLTAYGEAADGQILEEGITEAGAMASFLAAGTAYATHGLPLLPVFLFYSMFGFQRIGDLIWAAADMRCRGVLIGGTAGRTTLAGEGLQHQDGHSHLLAYPVPHLLAYDPAFAYEVEVILEEGLRRLLTGQEDLLYYLTVTNERVAMPPMPAGDGVREGILKGLYRYQAAAPQDTPWRAQLVGSGAILHEVLQAQTLLAERYQVAADVWSATSYKALYQDAIAVERWNRLHPMEVPRQPYLRQCLAEAPGVCVMATDYVMALPYSVARWCPTPPVVLGTDGFGCSASRRALRAAFEVDARHIAFAILSALVREQGFPTTVVAQAQRELDIDPEQGHPLLAGGAGGDIWPQ